MRASPGVASPAFAVKDSGAEPGRNGTRSVQNEDIEVILSGGVTNVCGYGHLEPHYQILFRVRAPQHPDWIGVAARTDGRVFWLLRAHISEISDVVRSEVRARLEDEARRAFEDWYATCHPPSRRLFPGAPSSDSSPQLALFA